MRPLPAAVPGPIDCASPPCYLHEVDPSYLGLLDREALLVRLDRLIEDERAGARGLAWLLRQVAEPPLRKALRELAAVEARGCARLTAHAARLGGTPSRGVGRFHARLVATTGRAAQLHLLDRGLTATLRELEALLPRVGDPALQRDLHWMRDQHARHIGLAAGQTGS